MTTKIAAFDCSESDAMLIAQIVRRALCMARKFNIEYDLLAAEMDITTCHCNGMPLDLNKLLKASDGDFGHDVFGIRRYIDRLSGELAGCFAPRCALKQ